MQKIKERILAGGEITPDEALELAQKAIRSDLYTAADEIRKKFCNKTLDTCSIINARSGHCPENCKWCAQSAHHHTQIETYDAIPIHEATSIARLNEQQGIKRLSLVTSGRRIKASEIDYFCDIYRKMGEETHLHLCASMGLLKREELEKLKAAGVKRYHCNLETASSYFSELCTTHTIEQKKETIRTAQELGMEICSGGIIGMGESKEDVVDMLLELKEINPEALPINFLLPIPGTPLGDQDISGLTYEYGIKVLCLARLLVPQSDIRCAAGREVYFKGHEKELLSVVDSIFASGYLTAGGQGIKDTIQTITDAGFTYEIESA